MVVILKSSTKSCARQPAMEVTATRAEAADFTQTAAEFPDHIPQQRQGDNSLVLRFN